MRFIFIATFVHFVAIINKQPLTIFESTVFTLLWIIIERLESIRSVANTARKP